MNFNLIQLLEQLKKFMQQENWSWFSLFLYIIVWLTLSDRLIGRLVAYGFPNTQSYIVWWAIVWLSIILWLFTRVVQIKKDKINIGIADLLIIHVNESLPLSYDQKWQLSNETAQYLYSQIQSEMYDGSASKQLNLIKLPSRVQVTFENERTIAEDLWLDILVRWTLKIIDGKYFLNYKLTFSKKLESWAFAEVIQSINWFPDVEFDLHGKTTDVAQFINQLMRVAILLSSITDMYERRFLSVYSKISDLSSRIQSFEWNNSAINQLILYLVGFVWMRNLLFMQDILDKSKTKDILQWERITTWVQSLFKLMSESLKKYFGLMKHDLVHDEQFEFEFLYAMSNNPARERTQDASFIDSSSSRLQPRTNDLLSGYFSLINDDLIDAKLHYNSVILEDPDNMIALRSLWIVEYRMWNYSLSKHYLEEYWKNNAQHIFFRHYKDTKVLRLLISCSWHGFHLRDAIRYSFRFSIDTIRNSRLKKKYIIL